MNTKKKPTVIPKIMPYKGYDKYHHPESMVEKPIAPKNAQVLEQAVADAMVPIMCGRHMPLDRLLPLLKKSLPFTIDGEVLKVTVTTISEKYRRGEGPTTAAYEPPKPPVVEPEPEPDLKVIEEN